MTSPNHTINSLDSEKLILTQYCATNRLRRTFMQTLYVIYCLKSSALVLVPPSCNQKHSNLNLWKLTIMITARLTFCLPYSIDILILCLKKSKLPCQKELNLRILIAKKGKGHAMHDECPSYNGHPWLTSYHLMGKTHIIWWKTYHMMGTHHKIAANWQKDRIPSYSFKKWWNSIINPEINTSMKLSLSEAFLTCLEYCFWYESIVMSK